MEPQILHVSRQARRRRDRLPFAEHVGLLEDLIPAARYAVLLERAQRALEREGARDIRLSKQEQYLLREAYQRNHGGSCGPTRAAMTLTASDGSELEFHCTLSDGYWDGSAWGPYDDGGFDETGYVEVE